MTPEKIAELRELESKATPAPWYSDGYRVYGPVPEGWNPTVDIRPCLFETKHLDGLSADDDLCAAIRNALPDLLSLAERAVEAEPETSSTDQLHILGLESRAQALDAELRMAREALEAICAKCHGFAVTSDTARLHGVADIAREALAKIGGGNE